MFRLDALLCFGTHFLSAAKAAKIGQGSEGPTAPNRPSWEPSIKLKSQCKVRCVDIASADWGQNEWEWRNASSFVGAVGSTQNCWKTSSWRLELETLGYIWPCARQMMSRNHNKSIQPLASTSDKTPDTTHSRWKCSLHKAAMAVSSAWNCRSLNFHADLSGSSLSGWPWGPGMPGDATSWGPWGPCRPKEICCRSSHQAVARPTPWCHGVAPPSKSWFMTKKRVGLSQVGKDAALMQHFAHLKDWQLGLCSLYWLGTPNFEWKWVRDGKSEVFQHTVRFRNVHMA